MLASQLKTAAEKLTEHCGRDDYYWTTDNEMHAVRRRKMLEKYSSEIKKLYGPDPLTWKIATAVVLFQIFLGSLASSMSWPVFLLTAYAIGGTATHNSFLAVHEITHNLAFRKAVHNELFAIFLNIIVPLPYAMGFKSHHRDHHNYLGWERVDPDLPTALEGKLLSSYIGKFFFVTFQVFFYALRPTLVRKMKITRMHVLNIVAQIIFDVIFYMLFGPWCIIYFFLSLVLGTGWHPLAGHFLTEHYIFQGDGSQETFSYYGPLNWLAWNVGHHVEHHDFPYVPWRHLHKLREIAPEFYENLEVTPSWPLALYDFVFKVNMNPFSRTVRRKGSYLRPDLRSAEVIGKEEN
ncbi:fatty acid desaturase, putative [Trypanosoma equiperdum]|uniref:sphingolipid 4-desaturase n=1 Tax=Trypanosoma equiperdum TaxID=5694 RepID=A0A1G4I6T2_TRYEQ|nr:fatty acid desaturase, putative [Trypanosoma equiperdum]